MSRIPFSIEYGPQIESGEYKVETRDGRKARIIHWDLNCTSPIVAVMDAHIDIPGEIVDVFSVSGRAFDDLESPSDLFIVTPEEELTEFEKKLWEVLKSEGSPIGPLETFTDDDKRVFLAYSRQLLTLAREQFIKDGYVIEKKAFHDAVENISDKHWAEMSIQYSIHCKIEDGTRHAVMNWPEFQKVAQKFIAIGKAEALKDLPRWRTIEEATEKRTDDNDCVTTETMLVSWRNRNDYGLVGPECMVNRKTLCVPVVELSKLPGFKED